MQKSVQNFYNYVIPRAHQSLHGCRIVHLHPTTRRLCQINRQRIAERSFADNTVILYTAAKVFKGCYFRVTKKWKKSESIAFLQKDLKNGTE